MSSKTDRIWSIEEVQNIIRSLAKSQGSYGRLANSLDCNDSWKKFTLIINDNKCETELDIIMLMEATK